MGPLRVGQELRSCQHVGLMAVKPTIRRLSSHRALRP